jgi:MinD superfamily P-loop ATPase
MPEVEQLLFEVRPNAECCGECLDVEGVNGHVANVNPIGGTSPVLWRVDCNGCATCIRAGFATQEEAIAVAKEHVAKSSEEFWDARDAEDKAAEDEILAAILLEQSQSPSQA